jgi:hypothetical protein
MPLLQTAGEFEFKEDFRRIQVVAKFRVVIQIEMGSVGVFYLFLGFRFEQRFAEA